MAYILVSFVFMQYSGAKCEKGVQKIIPSEDNTSGYLPAIFVCSLIYQGNPVTCHLWQWHYFQNLKAIEKPVHTKDDNYNDNYKD